MSDLPSLPDVLGDARLSEHATSASPAWLWSPDGARILWANPVGTAIFQATSAGALAARRFGPRDQPAAQIARIAGTLPHAGTPRLERLRGLGTGLGRTLLCRCSRIGLADQTRAVLIVALEGAGPALALAERVRRLVADDADPAPAIAAFARDGGLLFATAAARARLGAQASLAALGAERIAGQAVAAGQADGTTTLGPLRFDRVGSGADLALVAMIPPAAPASGAAAAGSAETTAAPAAPTVPAESAAPAAPAETPAAAPAAPPGEPATSPAAACEAPQDAGVSTPPLKIEVPLAQRRHPLRFVWQMDPAGRFSLGSDEFTEVIGPKVAIALGRPWKEVVEELGLDPAGEVERAVATRDTWSGITLLWPVDGADDRLKVELSGLPIYDRNRTFVGYRGFGVCRDVERINALAQMRRHPPGVDAPVAPPRVPEPPSLVPAPAAQEPAVPAAVHATVATVQEPAPAVQEPAPAAASPQPGPADAERPGAPGHAEERPQLTLVPAARNVVPFRAATAVVEAKSPALSPVERNAFRELARQLTARLKGVDDNGRAPAAAPPAPGEPRPAGEHEQAAPAPAAHDDDAAARHTRAISPLLDRLPLGILVYRLDHLIYANRVFLDWTGNRDLDALAEAGGLDTLFVEPGGADAREVGGAGRSIAIAANSGARIPVDGRLFSVPWGGEPALVLMLETADDRHKTAELALRLADAEAKELRAILETAGDGVLVVDRDGRILSSNARAQALFARSAAELAGTMFADLLAAESRRPALDSLAAVARAPAPGAAETREVAGRVRENAHVPLLMTAGRVGEPAERICVLLRDITAWKTAERELLAARQLADQACAARSEFLATVSHEIRTPLNSIIGFSEVMIDERFGPIGNERYREYLKDIRASGTHVVSLLDDFLDLSKIEAGQLHLDFAAVRLNETVQGCVALMQPQANREHIIIRTSLLPSLRPVLADARSLHQIVLNLLSNSIRFTGAGGQVIVSTALSDDGDVVLRVRDTGIGMSEADLAAALAPFRHPATAPRYASIASGLRLPLTKALAEANHAAVAIRSKVGDGTLVEISFPAARVVAD